MSARRRPWPQALLAALGLALLCAAAWVLLWPHPPQRAQAQPAPKAQKSPQKAPPSAAPDASDALRAAQDARTHALSAFKAVSGHAVRLAVQGASGPLEAARRLHASSPEQVFEALSLSPARGAVSGGKHVRWAPRRPRGKIRYITMVPRDYDPRRPWPVHFSLHGGGSHGTPERSCQMNWQGEAAAKGVILVCPRMKGGAWWVDEGERRVLAVLEDLRGWLNVDEAQVSLGGASSGAAGSWHLAMKFPWMWRAIAPRCSATPEEVEALGNMAKVPVFLMHGFYDGTILVQQSRDTHALLKARAHDVRYYEDPGHGHHFMHHQNGPMIDWMSARRCAGPQKRFEYRTVAHGQVPGRVHWIRPRWSDGGYGSGQRLAGVLEQRGDGGWVARIEGDAPLEGLTVLLPDGSASIPVQVHYNGQVVYTGRVAPSVGAVLESWWDHRRRAWLTRRAVRITLSQGKESH